MAPLSEEQLAEFRGWAERGQSPWWAGARELVAEVDRLRARVATLEGVLRKLEWNAPGQFEMEYICPSCYREEWEQHAPDCALDAALRDAHE